MNTHLPVKSEGASTPALLEAQQKPEQQKSEQKDPEQHQLEQQQSSQVATGKRAGNSSVRYPKDLERCFVLGNN